METKILTLEILDSFSGLGDSDEDLELVTLEFLDISLTKLTTMKRMWAEVPFLMLGSRRERRA